MYEQYFKNEFFEKKTVPDNGGKRKSRKHKTSRNSRDKK